MNTKSRRDWRDTQDRQDKQNRRDSQDRRNSRDRRDRQERQERQDRQNGHLNLTFQVTCDCQPSQLLRCSFKRAISLKENVGFVKEEKDQTISRCSIRFYSVTLTWWKLNSSVKNYKNVQNNIDLLFSYSFFKCLPLQLVHVLLSLFLLFYSLFSTGCFLILCDLRLSDLLHL